MSRAHTSGVAYSLPAEMQGRAPEVYQPIRIGHTFVLSDGIQDAAVAASGLTMRALAQRVAGAAARTIQERMTAGLPLPAVEAEPPPAPTHRRRRRDFRRIVVDE